MYPDTDETYSDVPEWQILMLEGRLKEIEKNPQILKDGIDELFKELDKEID